MATGEERLATMLTKAIPPPDLDEPGEAYRDKVVAAIARTLIGFGWKPPLPDEPGIGSVITWTMKYAGSDVGYSFAAIRAANGLWYLTGKETKGFDWASLVQQYLGKPSVTIEDLRMANEWEELQ